MNAPVRHASLGMGLGRIDPSEPGSDANRLLAIYLWRLQVPIAPHVQPARYMTFNKSWLSRA